MAGATSRVATVRIIDLGVAILMVEIVDPNILASSGGKFRIVRIASAREKVSTKFSILPTNKLAARQESAAQRSVDAVFNN